MATLLQTLLLQILPPSLDPVLLAYIEKVLPVVERGFGMISVFKRSGNGNLFAQPGTLNAVCQIICGDENSEQSSSTYILHCLLTAWNLLPFLDANLAPSDNERRLLCLSLTLQTYDNRCQNKATTPRLTSVITLGEILNFDAFWAEWREYLPEIDYLTQTTRRQIARMSASSARRNACKVSERRMKLPLYQLFSFGMIAAQLTSPADIVTKPVGDRLRTLLREPEIDRTLVYHRLRNCTGLLTNNIHNVVQHFTKKLNWQPILVFAEGVVYLAPLDSSSPDRTELRDFVWEQVSNKLATKMLSGETGLKRDGKGLKVAPQTLEFLSPVQLIRNLPNVVVATINNEAAPATPKRLKRLSLSALEQEFLAQGADLRSDRIAEFIVFLQKEFFGNKPEFITQVLDQLSIQSDITPEQTQIFSGGVNWGGIT